ncbi:hypothetical protein PV10_06244 [Exophiala mesophila]|uniref:Methyltransferase small domain-containing protein n=1 Tax=Exophiala mesophila TaxID=212818 RepID=A0A0D1WRG9_EXOME|nr:uncharacterized protein PV10_06244 [Exophiala mesophila]KIV91735.1 hypothetical protein PV10_06244 [Exophiala mesophila]
MLPTPSTSHVNYDHVYEPAEDSYLFLDTLSSTSEIKWLQSRFETTLQSSTSKPSRPTPAPLVVEIGPGSGVIIAFLTSNAKTIIGTHVLSMAIDVNIHACHATTTTVEKALVETNSHSNSNHSLYLSSVRCDLTSALTPNSVDILIFNPPYVPSDSVPAIIFPSSSSTPSFEESSHLLAQSYAGGHDGMQVTNRLLDQIPSVLSRRGVAYVLFCRGNHPDQVKESILKWPSTGENDSVNPWHWCAETVGSSGKKAGWEKLEIVRIWREFD